MNNFEIYNPTRIVFGKDQLKRLPELLHECKATKVMLVFGGGSIATTGLYQQITDQLNDFTVVPFGGVEANPEYETLMRGVILAKQEQVDFFLAVGGGSVIDGVKFMSGAYYFEGEPWDVLAKKNGAEFKKALPFGTVLTLPATGSEANSGAVISNRVLGSKRTMGGPQFFPIFSFCDPSVVATLPKRQISNGIVDAYMHTLEQYLTVPAKNYLQEREAEAILKTLIAIRGVVDHGDDYTLAANLMWCATHALNGNLRCGVVTDWSTHMIGHELTAKFGIDHARTLAIIAPSLYRHQFQFKFEKLVQYGKRVWELSGDDERIATLAIDKTERFFNELGIMTKLSEYTENYEGTAEYIRDLFIERGWNGLGEGQRITPSDVESIVKMAY